MESDNQAARWEQEARQAFAQARPGHLPLYVSHLPVQGIASLEALFVFVSLDGEGSAAQDLVFRHDERYSVLDCTQGMKLEEQGRQLAVKQREIEEQLHLLDQQRENLKK